MIVEIFIEGQRIQLFDNESISVTQSVQDVKDISKLFADYSQAFNVPASKTNNAIFKNWYNQDIDNGFDSRTRKDAIININTIPFKTGKIQLNGAKLEKGKPIQYSLTFYGDVIKVKDLIGDDKLNDLDWLDNFNHDYTSANVLTGLTTGLDFTVNSVSYLKAVVYPLISYKRQYMYNSDPTDTTSTDTLVNINYNASRSDGIRFENLKPAIKLSLIIKAIEEKYGFNFVGGFFDSQIFKEIYVNLNRTTESLSNGFLRFEDVDFTISANDDDFNRFVYGVTVTPLPGFTTTPYKIVLKINDQIVYESNNFFAGTQNVVGINEFVTQNANVKAEVISVSDFEFNASTEVLYELVLPNGAISNVSLFTNSYTNQVIDLNTIIREQIKDIKTYDFLIGLFKTFNLTVSPLDGDIRVEDLQTWYTQGDIIDITPYIDTDTKQVDKGVIFNEIDFSFKESAQILADEFKQSNNRIYGNEELTLYTDETETKKLDGKKLEVESIFENPIFERLFDLNDDSLTPIQYCPYFDRDLNSISENPFMFYVNSVDVSSNSLGWRIVGGYSEINTTVLMPSHSLVIDYDSFNLNFAAEINEYTSQVFQDTIYSRYYADYVGDVFSKKRRNFKYKGILPLRILNQLKLNDRLVIGNTRYLINSITSNLTKREDNLELVNDIYDAPLASDTLNTSLFAPPLMRFNSSSNTNSTQYIGKTEQSVKKLDTGFGTGWLTSNSFENSTSVSTYNFTIDANGTGSPRTVGIEIIDGENNPKFLIYQEE